MTKQDAIREAMRRANPDKEGDLLRQLRELNPEAAAEIEAITLMANRQRR